MPYKSIEDKRKYYESTKILDKVCLECGKYYNASKYKPNSKFCSNECRLKGNGKLSAFKRGEVQRGTGNIAYIKYNGQHLHRYLMEKKLSRKLTSDEIVHHKDGNKFNNIISNLELVTRSKHAIIHNTKNRKCKLKHNAKGYCHRHYRQILRLGRIIN